MAKELTIEERLLKFQEDQLAFQREQLAVQKTEADAALLIASGTAKRLAPKSLEVGEISQTSPFNLRGERSYPLPKLKCEMHAPAPMDASDHSLTREEVELFNLVEPGEYAFTLNDESAAIMRVEGNLNAATGLMERLMFKPNPPWNVEHRERFRPMTTILREMLGEKANGVLTMKAEKALIAKGELAVSVDG